MKNTISILTLLLLVSIFVSCSSDDNSAIVEDFTNVEYIEGLMLGTWSEIEYKSNTGNWRPPYEGDGSTYTFTSDGKYTYVRMFGGSIVSEREGAYVIEAATEIYNAKIKLLNSDRSIEELTLTDYTNSVVELFTVGPISGVSYYRYKRR